MAFVKLGINDALPTSTNLFYGYANGNSGSLDLGGYNQQLASIGSINKGTGANYHGGVTNTGGSLSTLTVNNTSLDHRQCSTRCRDRQAAVFRGHRRTKGSFERQHRLAFGHG